MLVCQNHPQGGVVDWFPLAVLKVLARLKYFVSQMVKMLKGDYNVTSLHDLGKAQRYDLARQLRFKFRSSNEQIRRVLNLTSAEVNTIFPMTAEK